MIWLPEDTEALGSGRKERTHFSFTPILENGSRNVEPFLLPDIDQPTSYSNQHCLPCGAGT